MPLRRIGMRKLVVGSGGSVVVLLVAALFTVLKESVAPTPSCGCSIVETKEYPVWLAESRTGELRKTMLTAPAGLRTERLIEILIAMPSGEGQERDLVNAWRSLPGSSADLPHVRSVTHRDGVVRIDLDRPVWSAPSAQVLSISPMGAVAMQQLVRTADAALNTADPVLLTVKGRPARGILRYPLDGPVSAARGGGHR